MRVTRMFKRYETMIVRLNMQFGFAFGALRGPETFLHIYLQEDIFTGHYRFISPLVAAQDQAPQFSSSILLSSILTLKASSLH